MTQSETIKDLRKELLALDLAIADCQDEYGNAKLWMKHRLAALVTQKESFLSCIRYFEINNIGTPTGNSYHCDRCDRDVCDLGPYERSDGDYQCQSCLENGIEQSELRAEETAI